MSFPDYYLNSVLDIEPQWLLAHGKDCVLIDLDNTLLPRDTSVISPEILAWAQRLRAADIGVCLISNNWHERVHSAARELNFALVSKAVKPLPPAFLLALRRIGGKRRRAVVIGDQIFTDMLGAKLLGITSMLVLPLAVHDLPHTLLLRKFEALILGKRQPSSLPPLPLP
jgi:HAD superfamily phosphatase (TIGR01668 family)